jgi:hypothetical protein
MQTRPTTTTPALQARNWAHVLTPVLAGVFILIATASDPAAGIDGTEMAKAYGADPDGLAIHALTLHFGYGLLIATALLAARLVHGRGAWVANLAVFLGFLGITTLPGLMFGDFFVSALTAELGTDAYEAVTARMDTMWGVPAFFAQGMLGAAFAPVLGAIALGRARVIPWWVVAVVGAALVTLFMGFAVSTIQGAVVLIGLLAIYSWALHRALLGTPAPTQEPALPGAPDPVH